MSEPCDPPYYRPGIDCPDKPFVPTQFCPDKPAGADPVTPPALPEETDNPKHIQVFAYDPTDKLFKPVEWTDGKLRVDTEIGDITIALGKVKIEPVGDPVNVFDEAPLVPVGVPTIVVQYTVPAGKAFWFKHASFGGQNYGAYRLYVDATLHDLVRCHDSSGLSGRMDWEDEVDTPGGILALAGQTVRIEVTQNGYVPSDHEGRIYGRLIPL